MEAMSTLATFAAALLNAGFLYLRTRIICSCRQKFQNARIVFTDHARLFEDLSHPLI